MNVGIRLDEAHRLRKMETILNQSTTNVALILLYCFVFNEDGSLMNFISVHEKRLFFFCIHIII